MFATSILENCPTRVRQNAFLREIVKQAEIVAVTRVFTGSYSVSMALEHDETSETALDLATRVARNAFLRETVKQAEIVAVNNAIIGAYGVSMDLKHG